MVKIQFYFIGNIKKCPQCVIPMLSFIKQKYLKPALKIVLINDTFFQLVILILTPTIAI